MEGVSSPMALERSSPTLTAYRRKRREVPRAPCGTRAIIFDGDDTLWNTQALYEAAKNQFVSFLAQYGILDGDVMRRIDEVDAQLVETMGFAPSRFPTSLE